MKRAKVTKVTRACDRCKTRKRRCDGELPCSVCQATESECTYNASYTRGKLVGPRPSLGSRDGQPPQGQLASPRPSLGSQDRHEPPHSQPDPGQNIVSAGEVNDARVIGDDIAPSSAYTFLRRAWERFGRRQADQVPITAGHEDASRHMSVLSYGDRQLPPVSPHDFEFPPRAAAERLLATYFDYAMPTYRFLHRQTVERWLIGYDGPNDPQLLPARQAIVLMVLATALLFDRSSKEGVGSHSEWLCRSARQILIDEKGKLRLESIQARLAVCLYLLHTSRPNEAWYAFGTTAQMSVALGIHRTSQARDQDDSVTRECRKRTFWAVATLDIYLSVMLGRPPLLHADDFDQQYPEDVDDEELVSKDSRISLDDKDSVEKASILHSKLAQIIRNAAREQAAASLMADPHRIDVADKAWGELARWKSSLPVVLSGLVHASSLISVFRRQIVVLQLAHAHASMLISRPILLMDPTLAPRTQSHVEACLTSAKTTLDMLASPASDGPPFTAFWFTQYVAFNAVSIVYVWLIQRKRGKMAGVNAPFGDDELLRSAEAVQKHFEDVSETNAPSLRYNIVLEELQQEARRLTNQAVRPISHVSAPTPTTSFHENVVMPGLSMVNNDTQQLSMQESLSTGSMGADMPLDPDLWLQLDSFPFCEFFFESKQAFLYADPSSGH